MFKIVSAIALAAASIAPAQAATSIFFSPGSSVIPAFTTAAVFQDFTTTNANGTDYIPVAGESTTGSVRTFLNTVSGVAVGPVVTPATGSFLSIGGNGTGGPTGSYTVALAGAQVFSFVFGGLDTYNIVTLNFLNGPSQVLAGTQVCGVTNTGCAIGATGRVTYDLGGTNTFVSAVFSSNQAAFEIDALASAAPEPATWAMLILGFGIAGSALRRRKGKLALAAA